MIAKRLYLIPLAVVFIFGFWGLRWGLPSQERTKLFLSSNQRSPEFYADIEKARLNWYDKMGQNPIAYLGRSVVNNPSDIYPTDIKLCFSSYLIRSHNADEQQTLVMISRLNPFKGRWYPYGFYYGGAYIYPLAVFLGIGKVTGIITLIPSTSFYYANPDQMANIYFFARIWSLIGLALTTIALFKFTEYHWDTRTAVWTTLFYVLLPAIFGLLKIVKPHIWSPLWTLIGIHFALEHKKNSSVKSAVLSAVFFGIAIGTTMSQGLYLLFLGGCLLQKNLRHVIRNGLIVGVVALTVYIILNPTLPFHLDDFKYEQLSTSYPIAFSLRALLDFFFGIIPYSTGRIFAATAYISVFYFCIKGNTETEKPLAWFVLITSVLIAFQMQGTRGAPHAIRLYIAHLGLLSLFVALLTARILFGGALRVVFLIGFLAYGIVYCRHFASDRAPYDNASQASLWIQEHVPQHTEIGILTPIPLVDQFPPLPFEDYEFTCVPSGNFKNKKPPYFILNGKDAEARGKIQAHGYELIQRFATSPLQRLGFEDRLSNANFPVEIYKRPITSKN